MLFSNIEMKSVNYGYINKFRIVYFSPSKGIEIILHFTTLSLHKTDSHQYKCYIPTVIFFQSV
jgi:hypothetical protein